MSDVRQFEEGLPHVVQEVMCVKCYKRYIDVRPEEVLLKDLECPQCGGVGYTICTGELISEVENEDL